MSDARNVTAFFSQTAFYQYFTTWTQNRLVQFFSWVLSIFARIIAPKDLENPQESLYRRQIGDAIKFNLLPISAVALSQRSQVHGIMNNCTKKVRKSSRNPHTSRKWCDQVQFTANQWPCPQRTQWPSLTMDESAPSANSHHRHDHVFPGFLPTLPLRNRRIFFIL